MYNQRIDEILGQQDEPRRASQSRGLWRSAARRHNLELLKRKEGGTTRGVVVGAVSGGTRIVVDSVEGWLPQVVTTGADRLVTVVLESVDVESGLLILSLFDD